MSSTKTNDLGFSKRYRIKGSDHWKEHINLCLDKMKQYNSVSEFRHGPDNSAFQFLVRNDHRQQVNDYFKEKNKKEKNND